MYTIYLITNLVNGKVYVGQTKQPLQSRWGSHTAKAAYARRTFVMASAIRKYGADKFTISAIDFANTREQADSLERTWIFLHNSQNKNIGYNVSPGGYTTVFGEETLGKISAGVKKAWAEGRITQHPVTDAMIQSSRERRGAAVHNYCRALPCSEFLVFLSNNGVNHETIAKHFDVSRSLISRRIKKTGLEYTSHTSGTGTKTGHHVSYIPLDEERLREYCEQGLTTVEIGAIFDCSYNTIRLRMQALGLTRSKK